MQELKFQQGWRASRAASADSACSVRDRHSLISEKCIHSGNAASVRATPSIGSPAVKKPSPAPCDIVGVPAVGGAPSSSAWLSASLPARSGVAIVLGVTARRRSELAAFDQLLRAVGARRVEQAIAG